jgi:hypothetical protein
MASNLIYLPQKTAWGIINLHYVPLQDLIVTASGVTAKVFHICQSSSSLRYQVLTAAYMWMTAFWDIAPCILTEVDRRLSGAYSLGHQGG